ncbi:hypothetical protein [Thalassotalea sp. ND16A]|uniref:hypothetical protein n=1 Tax=Thalassotalea sp. ND16A TaxID=1535422 RepID=UPI00051A59E1|nr:hypothetical protein [Thalassotalea sp. ND16A]KGJ89815.1 hypothetical protein ND16A_0185 [Thalassotalea sp. ND16A]
MSNQDQLINVVAAFEQWRKNRNGRQVPTPTPLRKQAVSLLNTYSSSKIIAALRISGTQLKRWSESLDLPELLPEFVHLPMTPQPQNEQLNVELSFTCGDRLCLSGDVSLSMITSMIKAMKS